MPELPAPHLNHEDEQNIINNKTPAQDKYNRDVENQRNRLEQKYRKFRRKVEVYSQHTDRGLDIYCSQFDLDPDDFRGKKILDVGSGTKESFSKEAAEYDAEVYSLSPGLINWLHRRKAKGLILPDKRWQNKSVAGRADSIPFKDDTFDMITSSWAIPMYAVSPTSPKNHRQAALKCFQEMLRVLKPGGKIYTYPVYLSDLGEEGATWLAKNGHSIDRQDHGVLIISKTSNVEDKL